MQRHFCCPPVSLINGWRCRTCVAALMRQFVQFCTKTMAVHFIAMCLRGCISVVAAQRNEEFSLVINQRNADLPGDGWRRRPALLWQARWLQLHLAAALKVSLTLCSVASTKSGAVNAGTLMPPSGYAERQQWIIYPSF